MSDTNTDVRWENRRLENHGNRDCQEIVGIVSCIGDKWTVLVVGVLSRGPMRYGEIYKSIKSISQRMLTLTLKGLERDGLVARTVFPTTPPRVEYALTEGGRTLVAPVMELWAWARDNRAAIENSRRSFDQFRSTTDGW